MPTLVLTTPTNPGTASWTDSTLIPGAGITVQKGATVVPSVYTINFSGGGVTVNNPGGGVANVVIPGGGGGAGSLQDSYDLGQSIDIAAGTGSLLFESTSGDGTFLIGNGTDLVVSVDTGTGGWTQTSATYALTADVGNVTLTSSAVGSKIETAADGTVTTATSAGTLFKASATINPAVPPAAPAATLDLWGTLLARLEPTGTLDAVSVLKYTAFTITANTTLPALLAGAEGRAILVANSTGNPLTVTPPVGGVPRQRTISPGGGSIWVWVAGGVNDWICLGWC